MKHLHLLLDEHIPLPKALPFLDKNHNIKHVKNLKIRGHDDQDIYMEAKRQKRVLVTADSGIYYHDNKYKYYKDVGLIYIVSKGQNYDLFPAEVEKRLRRLFSTITEKNKYFNNKIRLCADKAKIKSKTCREREFNLKRLKK